MSESPALGLEAWEARRKAWTTPNEHYLRRAEEMKEKHEQRQELVLEEVHRIAVYKRLVLQRQNLRTPLNLSYLVKYLFICIVTFYSCKEKNTDFFDGHKIDSCSCDWLARRWIMA